MIIKPSRLLAENKDTPIHGYEQVRESFKKHWDLAEGMDEAG